MTAEEFDEKFDDLARVVALREKEYRDAQGAVAVAQRAMGSANEALRTARDALNLFVAERAAGVIDRDRGPVLDLRPGAINYGFVKDPRS